MKRLLEIQLYEVNLVIVDIFLTSPSKYNIKKLQVNNDRPLVLWGIDFRTI